MHKPLPAFICQISGRNGRRSLLRLANCEARAGFTILELCVVLLVMAIVAAVAAPTFYSSLQYHELETAARRVALDLEQARHVARVLSEPQTLTFSNATTYTLSAGVKSLKSNDQTYSVDLSGHPYELDAVTLNLGGDTSVSFDGYGNTDTSGTIVLARGDSTRTVTLNGASGAISFSNP
jgi:type II secretion system protein H